MVLVQKWRFFQLFFFVNIGQENILYDILERKNASLGYKYKKFIKSKNWHFSKGVNPWFWSTNGHFSNFFFILYDILERENAFLGYKNKKFKKSKNWHFPILLMVLVQKWLFLQPFFFGNIGQENILYDVPERKNSFLGYKSKKLKKSKKGLFSKGVNPWFWSKNVHFSNLFFFGIIGQENILYDILERKNAFLAYKNKKFENSKNWHFSKGVNPWFWSKNGHFSNFFF